MFCDVGYYVCPSCRNQLAYPIVSPTANGIGHSFHNRKQDRSYDPPQWVESCYWRHQDWQADFPGFLIICEESVGCMAEQEDKTSHNDFDNCHLALTKDSRV